MFFIDYRRKDDYLFLDFVAVAVAAAAAVVAAAVVVKRPPKAKGLYFDSTCPLSLKSTSLQLFRPLGGCPRFQRTVGLALCKIRPPPFPSLSLSLSLCLCLSLSLSQTRNANPRSLFLGPLLQPLAFFSSSLYLSCSLSPSLALPLSLSLSLSFSFLVKGNSIADGFGDSTSTVSLVFFRPSFVAGTDQKN